MNKELELYKEFLNIIEFPVKSHLLNSNDKPTLERYRVLRTQIEDALEDYEKIKQAKIIVEDDEISKEDFEKIFNYQKMFTNTNLQGEIKPVFDEENQKKLKAFDIIKDKRVLIWFLLDCDNASQYNHEIELRGEVYEMVSQEEFDLLKEVFRRNG